MKPPAATWWHHFYAQSAKRSLLWHDGDLNQWNRMERAACIAGEVGEASVAPTRSALADELADIVSYCFVMAAAEGFDRLPETLTDGTRPVSADYVDHWRVLWNWTGELCGWAKEDLRNRTTPDATKGFGSDHIKGQIAVALLSIAEACMDLAELHGIDIERACADKFNRVSNKHSFAVTVAGPSWWRS